MFYKFDNESYGQRQFSQSCSLIYAFFIKN